MCLCEPVDVLGRHLPCKVTPLEEEIKVEIQHCKIHKKKLWQQRESSTK